MTAPTEHGPRAAVLPETVSLPRATTDSDGDSLTVLDRPSRLRPVKRWLSGYWKPLTMLAASRLVTFFIVYITRYVPGAGPVVGGLGGGHRFDRLAAWDGGWYILAAQHGWPHSVPLSGGFPAFSTLAFFPGFPLSIRAVHFLGFGWIAAGFLTALLYQVVMVVLLWQLAKDVWSESVADRGIMLFLFSPGALAFALIYSEPMLFAAAAACLLALRRRWWVAAGLAAAVGTAVRPVGVALIACCLWEAARVIRVDRDWRSIIAPVLSPLGIACWMGYLWAHTGSPFTWSKAEKAWDDSFDPFTLIKRFFFHEVTHTGQRLPHYLPVAGALFCIGALMLLWKARPPGTFVVYCVVVVIIAASSKIVGLRPRLVETAFPLIVVFGYWLKDTAYTIVVACSGVVLGGLLLLALASPRFIP